MAYNEYCYYCKVGQEHTWHNDGTQNDDTLPVYPPIVVCSHGDLIETIVTWSKAYPEDVFPRPDFDKLNATTEGALHTTQVSADMGRHIIGVLMELIPEAERKQHGG